MKVMEELRLRAKQDRKRLLFPEGDQPEIIQAAIQLAEDGLAEPVLISKGNKVRQLSEDNGWSLAGIEIIDTENESKRDTWLQEYLNVSDEFTEKRLRIKWKNPLNAALILLKVGYGEGVIAGISVATEQVILSALNFIGLADGYTTPSSSFLMEIPGFKGDQGELLAFSDCAVCVNPTPEELAEIGLATANNLQKLLNWEPKVAFLSFSTNGSGDGESVKKVQSAVELFKEKSNDFAVVGEVQADAALVRETANKKLSEDSAILGDANVLIFPNLDSGNIGYKLVQITTKAKAYGPILQGFSKPVADLSRGASVEDIIGTSILTSLLSEKE